MDKSESILDSIVNGWCILSKTIEEPPSIQVTFANGRKDTFELKHYKLNEHTASGCNYIGKLRKEPNSVVAVTGCIKRDGDRIEISMISEHNTNKNHMFRVDMKKVKQRQQKQLYMVDILTERR